MLDKAKLARLLRTLAQVVESSTDDELEALAHFNISGLTAAANNPNTKRRRVLSHSQRPGSVDVSGVIESMRFLSSREAGISLLTRHQLNKRSLEQIARHLDLPVLREDTSERLIQKIVEATLGPRLNSAAIRGEAGVR